MRGILSKIVFVAWLLLGVGTVAASAQGTVPPPKPPTASQSGKTSGSQSGKANEQSSQQAKKPKPEQKPKSEPVKKKGGITLNDVKFGNVDMNFKEIDPYGSMLNANEMRYLGIEIDYDYWDSKYEKMNVCVRVLKPDGSLMTDEDSLNGFTTDYNVLFQRGKNKKNYVGGVGAMSKSYYTAGTYTVEIYFDGKLQYHGKVKLK